MPIPAAHASASSHAPRTFSSGWWTGGHGFAGVAQFPNPAIAVWAIASLLQWTAHGRWADEKSLRGIADGALLVWALDELFRGTSPIRRIMGAVVLVVLFILFRQ